MPVVLSNELKALLVMEDVAEEGVTIWQNNSFTVQHFSYACERKRNPAGEPYGPTQPSYLYFTVRINSDSSAKEFFERMGSREPFSYSFLFNASFNEMRRMAQCEDALIARAYLVDVEESFEEQMLIKGKLLLCSLSYLGQDETLKLTITND